MNKLYVVYFPIIRMKRPIVTTDPIAASRYLRQPDHEVFLIDSMTELSDIKITTEDVPKNVETK